MKRVVFLCSLLLICSLGAGNVGQINVFSTTGFAFGQSGARKTCPFSITGSWRVEGGALKAKPYLYEFDPNGVLIISELSIGERTDDSPNYDLIPREYEVIGGGKYALDRPDTPKRIEFKEIAMDKRGVIPRGKTSLDVVEYGDNSFVTVNPKTQAQLRWVRTQTHRRFITFAGRSGPATSAFAMWITLDGRYTKIEALGLPMENEGREAPTFGPISERLSQDFEFESHKDSDVMFRIELSESQFERSHKVFEAWAEFARTSALPHKDPYLNCLEFLKSAAENLNQCDEKLKLDKTAGPTAGQNPSQQALEYIRMMRKKNKDLHVTNGMYPDDWRPAPFQN
jgi:hypothetical protein